MNLQFVSANPADIPIIFAQAKALIDTYEDLETIDYEKVIAWVGKKITDNITQYQCVMADGVRCAWYRLCDDGELDDLYVLPLFQNQGIGTEIMENCMRLCKKPLWLYVFSRNIRAISFYRRFGFTQQERVGKTRMILAQNG